MLKTKGRTRIQLLFLFLLCISQTFSYSCKWGSMRHVLLSASDFEARDKAQTNTLFLSTKTSTGGPGGLIYLNPVSFANNFHLYFTATVSQSSDNEIFEGMAIILGKSQNVYSGAGGENLGYASIRNAVVVELDFHQNQNGDMNSNHISLHQCLTGTCSANEDSNTIQRSLPSGYSYIKTRNNVFHVHILYTYSNNNFAVYLGSPDGTPIISTTLSLGSYFSTLGHLGFSTVATSSLEINIGGSFFCEGGSNYLSAMPYILYNGVVHKKYVEIVVGSTFYFYMQFNDARCRNYRYYTVYYECGRPGYFRDYGSAARILDFTGCYTAGRKKYTYQDRYITRSFEFGMIPASLSRLVYYGHDGQNKPGDIRRVGSIYYFKWGEFGDKDFEISSFKDGYFNALFTVTDYWGNVLDSIGTDSSELITKLGLNVKVSNGMTELRVSRYASGIYLIKVKVVRGGTYTISSTKLNPTNSMAFYVHTATPSDKSYCTTGLKETTLKDSVKVEYKCYFIDDFGDLMQSTVLRDVFGVQYKCLASRTSPSKKTIEFTASPQKDYLLCSYTTSENGSYNLNAYFKPKGGKETLISSTMNKFKVIPEPGKVDTANIFSYSSNKWYSNEKLKSEVLLFERNIAVNSILALDLVDTDGTSFSDIGYDNLNIKNFSGKVNSDHAPKINEATLSFVMVSINNKKYIACQVQNSALAFSLSSFPYNVIINYKKTSLVVRYKVPLTKNGNNEVCQHPLTYSKSQLVYTKSNNIQTTAGELVHIGTITLKTSDDYLYNHFVEDGVLTFPTSPKNEQTTVYATKSSTIDGIYELYMKSTYATTYTLSVRIQNNQIKGGSVKIQVNAINSVDTFVTKDLNSYSQITDTEHKISTVFNADGIPLIYFKGKDIFGNEIVNAPSSTNSNLGLTFKLYINDAEQSTDNLNFNIVVKGSIKNVIQITDNAKKSGTYKIEIISKTGNKITFIYEKLPGVADKTYSTVTVTNSIQVKYGSYSTASVELKDKFNNNIGLSDEVFNREIKKVTLESVNKLKQKITYTFSEKDGLNAIFKSSQLEKIGTFTMTGKVGNNVIPKCSSCSFDVVYVIFDTDASTLSAVLDTVIPMSVGSTFIINKDSKINPMFQFEFIDKQGNLLDYVNPETQLYAKIKTSQTEITLKNSWLLSNTLLFTFADADDINKLNGVYNLVLEYNGAQMKSYSINIIEGNDFEQSEINDAYIIPERLNVVAGEIGSFIVELRTKNSLRYDKEIDIEKLEIKANEDYNDFITIYKSKGDNKGQIYVDVTCKKSSSFEDPVILTIKYDGKEFNEKVKLNSIPGSLYYFEFTDASYKEKEIGELLPGTTNEPSKLIMIPYDEFGNVNTKVFNNNDYPEDLFASFISTTHSGKGVVEITTKANAGTNEIEVEISSTVVGKISLTSQFLKSVNTLEIKASTISSKSTGEAKQTTVSAGSSIKFDIYPRDNYGNLVENIEESDIEKFVVSIIAPKSGASEESFKGEIKTRDEKKYIEYNLNFKETGENVIKASIGNEEIKLSKNIITVTNAETDYSKTKIIFNNKEYSPNEEIKISKSLFPQLYIQLYDKEDNKAEMKKDEKITVSFVNDIFCVQEDLISICPSKFTDWNNLKTEEAITLTLQEKVSFKIILSGSADNNVSEKDYDFTKASLSKKVVEIVAGKKDTFVLELKTKDNKRKNEFYDNPEEKIKITFSKNDEGVYTTHIYRGEHFGQYIISISSTKAYSKEDKNFINLQVDGKSIGSTSQLIVNSAEPTSSYFIDSEGKKIENGKFPAGKADSTYVLRQVFFDKYDNKASPSHFSFEIIPSEEHPNFLAETSQKINSDNTNSILIEAIYSGRYTIKSPLFTEKDGYYFDISNGEIDASNTLISVDSSSNAGAEVTVAVILYDVNGNYIEATEEAKDKFKIYYRYPTNSNEYSNYNLIEYKSVVEIDKKKALGFKVTLTKSGFNYFNGYYENSNIGCKNCAIKVSAADFSVENSVIEKFNVNSKLFTEMKEGEIEYNQDSDALYRLNPKDKFGNSALVGQNELTAEIKGESTIKLSKSRETSKYVEFTTSGNDDYHKLAGGEYTIQFTDKDGKKIEKKITITGNKNGDFYKNQELDISKTKINKSSINFVAGDPGYIIIELRTKNNLLYTSSDASITVEIASCKSDSSFKYQKFSVPKQPLIYVKIESTLSNTFPIKEKCELTIKVNTHEISTKPEMTVNPSSLSSAEIVSEYLKEPKKTELKETNADSPLIFKVLGKDKYNNVARTSQSSLKISVKNTKSETFSFSSSSDIGTGSQTYIIPLTKTGVYTISAGTTEDGKKLFTKDYTVTNTYGTISKRETTIFVTTSTIVAGQTAEISITPRDKNLNLIPPEKVKSDFVVSVIAEESEDKPLPVTQAPQIKGNSLLYRIVLTKKGENKWVITLNKETVEFNGYTEVTSSQCEPKNTETHTINSKGEDVIIVSSVLDSSQDDPISLSLVFKDQYNNVIDTINDNIKVTEAIMSGNNMDPIQFTAAPSADRTRITIELPSEKEENFQHLVQRENYTFKYRVTYGSKNNIFTYTVSHKTNKGEEDVDYGNGFYVPASTVFEPKVFEIVAGESKSFTVSLKTSEGLLYNNNIDLENQIKCVSSSDPTFTCSFMESKYGIFVGTISSTKATTTAKTFTITIMNQSKSFVKAGDLTYTILVGSPDPDKTVISNTTSIKESYKVNEEVEIGIVLFDRFDNKFINREDIVHHMYPTNNQIPIKSGRVELGIDGYTYKFTFKPSYPPRTLSLNLFYENGSDVKDLLVESISSTIITTNSWENSQVISNNAFSMKAGEDLDIKVYLFDSADICITNIDPATIEIKAKVTGPLNSRTEQKEIEYKFVEKIDEEAQSCNQYFSLETNGVKYTQTGMYYIQVIGGGNVLKYYNQNLTAGNPEPSQFVVEYNYDYSTNKFVAGNMLSFTALGYDIYKNKITTNIEDVFDVKVFDENKKEVSFIKEGAEQNFYKNPPILGEVNFQLSFSKTGIYTFKYYYEGEEIESINTENGPSTITVSPDICSADNSTVDMTDFESAYTTEETKLVVRCRDKNENNILQGGENVEAQITLFMKDSFVMTSVKSKVGDLGNGAYEIIFTPPLEGNYQVIISINGEQVGGIIKRDITARGCSDGKKLCPNKNECVDEIYECIEPKNDCPHEKPFKCLVNEEEVCTESKNNCDCPEGFKKCGYNSYCIRETEYEYGCPFTITVNCLKYKNAKYLCDDGICRVSKSESPNKRVCPIGTVLCPDLTCRTSYENCEIYPQCEDDEVRCEDQTCVKDQKNCPSMVTCSNKSHVVCPDGSCVENEVFCPRNPTCSRDIPFLCNKNSCAVSKENCPKTVACGHGKSLCTDNICRERC